MNKCKMYICFRQEQVHEGVYSPLEVRVETDEGSRLCRTYKRNNFRPCPPSLQYKQVVCLEAQQNRLPQNYIKKLLILETNNYSSTSILDFLHNQFSKRLP
ncbi:gamma-glutamylcyclotransferase-like, partial [Xyrauchen texanus]|uniref:gamma-glutamylcyclotransferase-like n=1 Tax=Xyrauchen texanus TaxID=154827 RepID=UPI002241B095